MAMHKITAKELADRLDGRQYLHEISKAEEQIAKDSDLLVVFGFSDDCCELRGVIDDEIGCYNGGAIRHPDLPGEIRAVWCPDDLFSWGYETTLPHTTFRIHEDGEPYCIGIVIDLALARAEYYWCEECCNFDRDHVGPDGYAKCRFTRLLTFGQTYGKDCRGWGRPAENFPEVVRCGQCKKAMTPACMLCSFSHDGYCTGGPDDNFYCAEGERRQQ